MLRPAAERHEVPGLHAVGTSVLGVVSLHHLHRLRLLLDLFDTLSSGPLAFFAGRRALSLQSTASDAPGPAEGSLFARPC